MILTSFDKIAGSPHGLKATLLSVAFLLLPLPSLAITLQVEQVGADVVITGSGSVNTSALTLLNTNNQFDNVFTEVQAYAGPATNGNGDVGYWDGITGPLSINGNFPIALNPSSSGSSGDLFGIVADAGSGSGLLILPTGYMSGNNLSGTSRFEMATLASLGLSPGVTLTWNWGSGSSADSLNLQVLGSGTPVPGPLPLAGAALAWTTSRRLRRVCKRLESAVQG